ncbi:MAG TPA: hypothetical protein VFV17_04590 [Usitatibacteraceae bacterium]|nr:hypothetical protein [Usitatibacteraceae bacterium]
MLLVFALAATGESREKNSTVLGAKRHESNEIGNNYAGLCCLFATVVAFCDEGQFDATQVTSHLAGNRRGNVWVGEGNATAGLRAKCMKNNDFHGLVQRNVVSWRAILLSCGPVVAKPPVRMHSSPN